MDWEGLTKAIVTVGTPLATLIGFGGRRYRLRKEIRDNLALLSELEADEILSKHTPAPGWRLFAMERGGGLAGVTA